jgi:hypothetical protein
MEKLHTTSTTSAPVNVDTRDITYRQSTTRTALVIST